MSAHPRNPGGAAVGRLDELPPLERRVIRCLRLWCAGEAGQQALGEELARRHGPDSARRIAAGFSELVVATVRNARRPLMGHAVDCPCAGSDECVFARFVALSAEGAREEAVLIAALMVRADLALGLAALAEQVGLGLMRMQSLRVVQ
jgi:hypothetical protein